ncbi:hypothetical protein HII36_28030 [Nonomuraea sp. NN258]|uniref:hypothetical protein n=1 Tax=Nonomuraea antri TaxID=2730852 RepID=UPI001569F4E2|nr:hypothetical protein [Nonomuraea antri]NRQ35655.1 hypothetical protein [Nonomuraea antri]
MPLLWDDVIERHAEDLESLTEAELRGLALDIVQATLPLFEPPFPEYFPADRAELVRSAVREVRDLPPGGRPAASFVEDWHERFDTLPHTPIRPGAGPFTMAALRLVDAAAEGMSADEALEIASACYESILVSRLTGRVTREKEEGDARCREAVRVQEEIIGRYLNR